MGVDGVFCFATTSLACFFSFKQAGFANAVGRSVIRIHDWLPSLTAGALVRAIS